MLIVAGSITTEPDGRQVFLDAVQPMVAATNTEPGCREYAFTPDPDDETRVLLYELWDDQDALDGHFASEHMATWQAASATLPVLGADIKKYTISDVGPVR
ncbi:MAG: antibiotic biosynthesis monooxygenase [Ilumatobacter sp.]|nr:antibiotic biosynthesis monooxygenase [Ilumatobacter sp.]